jgi:hypothetical protein
VLTLKGLQSLPLSLTLNSESAPVPVRGVSRGPGHERGPGIKHMHVTPVDILYNVRLRSAPASGFPDRPELPPTTKQEGQRR